MTETIPAPLTSTDQQRLTAAADKWKRNLLDLSKRNRALNFKPQPVSTVTIVDELPSVVFTKFWIKSSSMRFGAVEEKQPEPTSTTTPVEQPTADSSPEPLPLPDLLAEEPTPSPVPTPESQLPAYPEADVKAKQQDNILQTTSTQEKLDKSLRRLADQARLTLDEQGLNPLFLSLGMLCYKETPESEELLKAPIILVPVELSRKSARVGYTLSSSGDDPIINPALVEYLRRSLGLILPELPDAASLDDDYDLQKLLDEISAATEGMKDREVTNEIYLGLFSFQKFVMYKDLEQNVAAIAAHRLVQQLVLHNGKQYGSLPADMQTMDLDKDFAPEATAQVVDADSSQLRAIATVARSYDLVLEGPPGTGKSQTITNLIAQALAEGKSVLFVAEKNAALKVVHQRLVNAGLGDFCLELHSTKANKRAVMQELARSLDASLQRPASPNAATQRLPAVRNSLTDYVRVLHQPVGSLNVSPYQIIGRFGTVLNAPRWKYVGPIETITPETLAQIIRELGELAETAQRIGDPRLHPWRDTAKTFYTEDDFDEVRDTGNKLLNELPRLKELTRQLAEQIGLHPIQSPVDLQTALSIVELISRSLGVAPEILLSEDWNDAPPTKALDLISQGRDIQKRKQAMEQVLKPAVFERNHTDDIAYVRTKTQGIGGVLAILDGRYREIQKQWKTYRQPAYRASMRAQADFMAQVVQLNHDRQRLASLETNARQYFGSHWRGEASDWNALERYAQWVVEFHKVYRRHGLGKSVLALAQLPNPHIAIVATVRESAEKVSTLLNSLRQSIGWPEGYQADSPYALVEERTQGLLQNMDRAHQWIAFELARRKALDEHTSDLIKQAMDGQVAFAALPDTFQRAFYQAWLVATIQARRPLLEFNTLMHEQRIGEFRKLDQSVLLENRMSLVAKLRDEVQRKLQADDMGEPMSFLRREMARQRMLSPLRRTFKQAGNAIRAIKPCFMMSPLTVAQLLDGSQPSFDLVIFDEASQLPAEDAVGTVIRGQQLVVVGDPKQLPPTNFFEVMSGQVSAPMGDDGLPQYEDGESVLEEFMGAGLPTCRLKWHYRSAHEALISFSNKSFYDGELYTFPSVEFSNDKLGVRFEYIEGGTYEGKGLNLAEARRVVDAIVEHTKTSPELSLGVGTFNLRQQLAIQDELEQRRRLDPEVDAYFSKSHDEPFFVKNLENIQGDERDVIFISVTYGKGLDGKLRYNFGPLNGQNGWRRLNVLVSRARRRMRVFSSIRGEDISPVGLTSAGALLLRDFLLYAEYGRLEKTEAAKSGQPESPFEHDVYNELTKRDISVIPQVGAGGYRVDLGVVDPAVPGRYICGIECDGVAYHASETARDRDRLRQQVLELRGWTIYRLWSIDWFKDRAGQLKRIQELVAEARESAKANLASEEAARAVEAAAREAKKAQPETPAPVEPASPESNPAPTSYIRPTLPPYRLAEIKGAHKNELLEEDIKVLAVAVAHVATIESPLQFDDIVVRVASFWGKKPGKRIIERIQQATDLAEKDQTIVKHDNFIFDAKGTVQVRSRSEMKVTPDEIAPDEYRDAVLLLLRTGETFPRDKLINETRAMFGFSRTTAALETLIDKAIIGLLADGLAGEGSNGIGLRQ